MQWSGQAGQNDTMMQAKTYTKITTLHKAIHHSLSVLHFLHNVSSIWRVEDKMWLQERFIGKPYRVGDCRALRIFIGSDLPPPVISYDWDQ